MAPAGVGLWRLRVSVAIVRRFQSGPARTMHALVVLSAGIWPALHLLSFGFDLRAIAAWIGLGIWLLFLRAAYREVGRLPTHYYQAFVRSDADALATLGKLWLQLYDHDEWVAESLLNVLLGDELLARKQWALGRDALAKVNPKALNGAYGIVLRNNLAYATARSGDPATAIPMAESALAEAKETDASAIVPSVKGTLGIALTLDGRHEEALPLLEEAVRAGGEARSQNERLYWLGHAYRALGRSDDAVDAFTRSASFDGPSTEDARAALAERTPFRG